MNYSCVFFGILFITAGVLFACGKLHTHLSAWKQMADEEKDKIHIRPLCLNIGGFIVLNGMIFLLRGLIAGVTPKEFTIAIVAWMVAAGFDLWHISKSKKYIKK